ncbi:DUF3095 domain-containing protein [Pedobacter sp. PWIIR3]
MQQKSEHFYNSLPASEISLAEMFLNPKDFRDVPADWHVIITDIKGSTNAVKNGLHETVNLIATGSIVAVLNLAYKANVIVPFFFGGDGATFLVPPSILDPAMLALQQYKINTLENFNLDLRSGTVPVTNIYNLGYQILLNKAKVTDVLSIPVLLGDGLGYAEKIIKGKDYLFAPPSTDSTTDPDLTGMQCRWDKISPPDNSNEIVTMLIVTRKGISQPSTFRKIFLKMDSIYGPPQRRQPISVSKLKFNTSFGKLSVEMKAREGHFSLLDFLRTWLINLYGYIYFRTKSGINYLNKLVEMSDTLVIDGRINTVISGTDSQRLKLQHFLDQLEKEGLIWYGLYVSTDAVMSCYVRDLADDHIHFVDGAEGGYTKSAEMLKKKIASSENGQEKKILNNTVKVSFRI